jgi:hypothetical protein
VGGHFGHPELVANGSPQPAKVVRVPPFFAGAFVAPPQAFDLNTFHFDGVPSGFTVPQWLLVADAVGAATVTATNMPDKDLIQAEPVPERWGSGSVVG